MKLRFIRVFYVASLFKKSHFDEVIFVLSIIAVFSTHILLFRSEFILKSYLGNRLSFGDRTSPIVHTPFLIYQPNIHVEGVLL